LSARPRSGETTATRSATKVDETTHQTRPKYAQKKFPTHRFDELPKLVQRAEGCILPLSLAYVAAAVLCPQAPL
jgi:hypothetical protein